MVGQDPADDGLLAARVAREQFGAHLLTDPDVQGVGVGYRRRAGEKTSEYAIVVHVGRKLPAAQVPSHRFLPAALRIVTPDGHEVLVPVDVQERAAPVLETDSPTRVRPVPGGVSAGGSGTLGGWVWDTITNQVVALSNRHVFGAREGTEVCQPSSDDGGVPASDRIASVLRVGTLDAAIAVPVDAGVVSASIVAGGPAVFEIGDAVIGMRVQKTGRTTGCTFGVVDLIDYDSEGDGSRSDLWIDGDGMDFSDAGDSGALYLESGTEVADGRHRAVGLHWGGSGKDGVGHHLRAVFDDLALTTLPVPPPRV